MERVGTLRQGEFLAENEIEAFRHVLGNFQVEQFLAKIALLQATTPHLAHKIFLLDHLEFGVGEQEEEIVGEQRASLARLRSCHIPHAAVQGTLTAKAQQILENLRGMMM